MPFFTGRTGAQLHVEMAGWGTPIVALHGAYSAHTEIQAVLEPIVAPLGGYRRLYPDLPGMGDSPAHDSVDTTEGVVDLLQELVTAELGDQRYLLVGHSYGGHLARCLAARQNRRVAGMALICPMLPPEANAEPAAAVADGNPARWVEPEVLDDYRGYFVRQTPETAERFNRAVVPALGRFDAAQVERMMGAWAVSPDPDEVGFDGPTLVVTGRHDAFVGFRDQLRLVDLHPRATVAVVADAGHALPHEHPGLLTALVHDWLSRATGSTEPSGLRGVR